MLSASFVFALLLAALILLFFSFLPDLRFCALPVFAERTEERGSGTWRRRLPVLCVTILYAVTAFWNLGNKASPQSFADMAGESAVFFSPEADSAVTEGGTSDTGIMPAELLLFCGVGMGDYSIEVSDDQNGWFPVAEFSQDYVAVLKWHSVSPSVTRPWRYMRIHCKNGNPWLGEVAARDASGQPIALASDHEELTDEQNTVPSVLDYHNSSYFDEIYHARTAWEHLNGVWPYEISHPPLGKEILSVGILLFGMTPFGWRFSGTLTGVLMLPLMYRFLRRIFGGERVPFLGTVLLAAGFMHYTQTRIATIDSYAVFFILLMFDRMYAWLTKGRTRDLLLCGLAFGLGAATKWTCLYAGAGLGVLWLGHWIAAFIRVRKDRPEASGSADGREEESRQPETGAPCFVHEEGKTILAAFLKNAALCLVFFVAIPCLIYYLSYLPYGIAEGKPLFSRDYTKLVLDNQSFMFSYHVSVKAEHPYSSRWYEWVLNLRPILYYLEYLPGGMRVSIAAFNNPLICWGGLLAVLALLFLALYRKDPNAAFLLTAYGSGLVPWMFIRRLTFAYHYFASVVMLVPALCYMFRLIESREDRAARIATGAFTVLAVVLFAAFFPVLSGLKVNNDLTSALLGWLPGWPI